MTWASDDKVAALKERYGQSEHGNFYVCDTIPVPHPYCIGPKHVVHASDHFCGMLNEAAIVDAELHAGAKCETPRCTLKYEDHKHGLLILCKLDINEPAQQAVGGELHNYLLASKDKAIEDKYAGFAFLDNREEGAQ